MIVLNNLSLADSTAASSSDSLENAVLLPLVKAAVVAWSLDARQGPAVPCRCDERAAEPSSTASLGCTRALEPLLVWKSTKCGASTPLNPGGRGSTCGLGIPDPEGLLEAQQRDTTAMRPPPRPAARGALLSEIWQGPNEMLGA